MNKKIYFLLITFVFSLFFFVRCTEDYTTFDETNKNHNHTNEKLNSLLSYLNLNSEENLKEHLSDFINNDFKLNIDFHKITETKNKDGVVDKIAL
jgi:spore coat protein CotH